MMERAGPAPGAFSIYGLSYIGGVLGNGEIDRRLPGRRFLADFACSHAVSASDIKARLEYDRVLLVILAPLQWVPPTGSQQLWEE
jgi:hypothetical protein